MSQDPHNSTWPLHIVKCGWNIPWIPRDEYISTLSSTFLSKLKQGYKSWWLWNLGDQASKCFCALENNFNVCQVNASQMYNCRCRLFKRGFPLADNYSIPYVYVGYTVVSRLLKRVSVETMKPLWIRYWCSGSLAEIMLLLSKILWWQHFVWKMCFLLNHIFWLWITVVI